MQEKVTYCFWRLLLYPLLAVFIFAHATFLTKVSSISCYWMHPHLPPSQLLVAFVGSNFLAIWNFHGDRPFTQCIKCSTKTRLWVGLQVSRSKGNFRISISTSEWNVTKICMISNDMSRSPTLTQVRISFFRWWPKRRGKHCNFRPFPHPILRRRLHL